MDTIHKIIAYTFLLSSFCLSTLVYTHNNRLSLAKKVGYAAAGTWCLWATSKYIPRTMNELKQFGRHSSELPALGLGTLFCGTGAGLCINGLWKNSKYKKASNPNHLDNAIS